MAGGPGTLAVQRLALRPMFLPKLTPPVELPPHDLRALWASLPPTILYECICMCEDECLHMNDYELNDDD
jgi:hypothetical protein